MRTRTIVAMYLLAGAGAAAAQPTTPAPVPTADPSRRPSTPAPPPTTTTPAAPNGGIQVIRIGPDGNPVVDQPVDNGFFYDDGDGQQQVYDDPQNIRYGPTPELHVVRSGDTLWDICFYYFNDPWQWPKVWSYNAQVTNPHWIYPGDLIRLLPRGTFVGSVVEPDTTGGGDTQPDVVPPPSRRLSVKLRQIAFVEQSELQKSMKIDGSVDDKELLSVNDAVYISYPDGKPPKVGKRYSIYQADNEVPGAGSYVKILGQLEVTSVKKDKLARGVITDATYEIERGALVGPLIREFKTVPPTPAKVDLTGNIIAMLMRDQLVGEGEVVFMDLGDQTGLEVGNEMYVIRRGDAFEPMAGPATTVGQDDSRYPARMLGKVTVVEVGKTMSIGLVTLSVQEMGIGDQVLMQKAKTAPDQ